MPNPYQDYEVEPYISPERLESLGGEVPKTVPKRNMILLEDGLLAGDIILLWRVNFGTFTTASPFPKYFETTYGIDAKARLERLIARGYVYQETAFASLDHINSSQKKSILKAQGVTGLSKLKKADLDQALVDHFSEEELAQAFAIRGYALMDKGVQALTRYQDVVDRHPQKKF